MAELPCTCSQRKLRLATLEYEKRIQSGKGKSTESRVVYMYFGEHATAKAMLERALDDLPEAPWRSTGGPTCTTTRDLYRDMGNATKL